MKKIGDGGYSSVYHVYNENRKSMALKLVNLLKMDGYTDKELMNEIELLKVKTLDIRVDRSGENFPKSILIMFFGWENTTRSVFIKAKISEKKF